MKKLTQEHLDAVDKVLRIIEVQTGLDRSLLEGFYQYFLERKRNGDSLLPLNEVMALSNTIVRQSQTNAK